jgi:hypothetical protein
MWIATREVMTALTADVHVPPVRERHDVGDVVQMIKAEYLEMPGLCLTLPQAQRLWDLDRDICAAALGRLVEIGFLCCAGSGIYGRNDTG